MSKIVWGRCFVIAIFNTSFATQRLATRKALFYPSKTKLSTGRHLFFLRKKCISWLAKKWFFCSRGGVQGPFETKPALDKWALPNGHFYIFDNSISAYRSAMARSLLINIAGAWSHKKGPFSADKQRNCCLYCLTANASHTIVAKPHPKRAK